MPISEGMAKVSRSLFKVLPPFPLPVGYISPRKMSVVEVLPVIRGTKRAVQDDSPYAFPL